MSSNQNKTLNRVTLLESIEAARNAVVSIIGFHNVPSEIWAEIYRAAYCLGTAEIVAAQLEAWGDGP